MAGKQSWLDPFLEFIGHLSILSKELDAEKPVPLLDVLYGAQMRFLRHVCEGLDDGIHSFVCLKARQLGISTISLAMDLFWLSIHDGLQGALITDTDDNKEKFRLLIEHYINVLPMGMRIGIKKHNRNNLVLANGSVLDYMVAGVKKTRAGSGLGTSRALNFVHATEVSRWGTDDEGLASLIATLAQKHPARLYIWESTAKGPNLFQDMYRDAQSDELTQRAFFIGWWAKEDYAFPDNSPEFVEYWDGNFDDGELERMAEVREKYGFTITPNQIAWHRWMRTKRITNEDRMAQEYPWTEDEAFVMTGASFFPLRRVAEDIQFIKTEAAPLKAYHYKFGDDFLETELVPVATTHEADLRIWEEPRNGAVYVMGVDPSYGRSDTNDNHAIELYRCYADKLVQVAEYATSQPESYTVAWVMCHLAGVYGMAGLVWINLEVNGPGAVVMAELKHLKQLMQSGRLRDRAHARGLFDVFTAVRWYLYHRPDSPGAGYVYNWKTNSENKMRILNQMRDCYALRQLRVRSVPLLQQMERIRQEGSSIEATGRGKDDQVFASALATIAWVEWVRRGQIEAGYTYEKIAAQEMQEQPDQHSVITRAVEEFFKLQETQRERVKDAQAWAGDWW